MSRSKAGRRSVISFHIPWTKTTGILGGEAILTSTDNEFVLYGPSTTTWPSITLTPMIRLSFPFATTQGIEHH
ncbi:hypothetical protein MVEN_00079900 [Mycena venus]|uniref:Uncharacterized protein n=1 Tax=Mycena venus TaxID=2733690 RepID=A0A8H7DI48_9AGAR|nr:hypothetical protein MVEN_00079900 [Mycena venus]